MWLVMWYNKIMGIGTDQFEIRFFLFCVACVGFVYLFDF